MLVLSTSCIPIAAGYPPPVPKDTIAPVLALNTQQRVIELLRTNGGCKLPCFWSINAGETSWSNVQIQMENLTKKADENFVFYQDNNSPAYVFAFDIREDGGRHLPFVIIPTIDNNKVQRIHIMMDGDSMMISAYWKKYSLREVFEQLGMPDQVLMHTSQEFAPTGFDILVLYREQKIAIDLAGENMKQNIVCPQLGEGDKLNYMKLSIANPKSSLALLPPDWIPSTASEYWSPIQDVLEIDEQIFYGHLLSDRPACFEVKATGQ